MSAYNKFKRALDKGILVRPEACEKCGAVPGLNSAGRAGIQGHHTDYTKPLDVEWVCVPCHRRADRTPIESEKHGRAKLNSEQAREIRESSLSQRRLASLYGIDRTTVRAIKQGKTWRNA